MSEPKLITPLLEDHVMGAPISDHHGVRCCPAMQKDSDEKYIVKIISVPASQVQLDALLLTGAYSTPEDALTYFRELSEATVQEAELLQRLAKLEGFSSYEGWQIVPMEDGIGFDVYLLGAYRQTLERYFKRSPMTHLGAVNLGLDLCAALSVCRRGGYLYVDLKPGNIFISENQEYRIGDLGFIRLDSLKYASLPDKYRSEYTAPEISDAYSALNSTIDIYALGLILYQAYNNGQLPPPGAPIPPPAYADYEMAEIILKACAENPEDRWQQPMEMGQALVSYMQRNGANDTPIVPISIPDESTETENMAEETAEETLEKTEVFVPADESSEPPMQDEISSDEGSDTEDVSAEEDPSESIPVEDTDSQNESIPEDTDDEQFVIDGFSVDETVPTEESTADLPDTALSDETSDMLAQADALIAHEPPAPVVAPEPIDVPIPPRPVPEPEDVPEEPVEEPEVPAEETEVPEAEQEEPDQGAAVAVATEETAVAEEHDEQEPPKKKKVGGLIAVLSVILVLLMLAVGAGLFYHNYYLQPVLNIDLSGEGTSLTVVLDTETDNSLLTVFCTDTYGNTLKQPVTNNTAQFTELRPGTSYTVSVRIDGFHKLIGTTSKGYSTAPQTNIVSFTAVTGDTDGSVNLHFSVQGPDNTAWLIKYAAPGQEEKTAQCSGHMASITGLTVGSVYTFRLEPASDLYVVGTDTLEYTASKVIYPENLAIQGFDAGALIVTWDAPEGAQVSSWTVRCYNNDGFDKTFTVTEAKAAIEGLDPASSYTIDVKANGMSVSKWVSLSANSVTFKDILLDDSTPGKLVITWNYEGTAPEDGWMLFYTVDGSDKQVVHCDKNTCTISPLIPGAHYVISFELPENVTVFGGTAEYDVPDNGSFNAYGVTANNFTFRMCWTSKIPNWKWYNLMEREFSNTYAPGEKASFVVLVNKAIEKSNNEIGTLFVVKDSNGKLVSVNEGRTRSWNAMWTSYNGRTGTELDLPSLPQTAGSYTVDIYFSGAYVTTYAFAVK